MLADGERGVRTMLLYPMALASGDRLLPRSVYVRDAADQRLLAAVQASVSTGVQWHYDHPRRARCGEVTD
jgi:hypothetical protein